MVDEAVKLEKEFFDNVLSGSNQQLTKVQVGTDHRHIEEAQDQILEELGLKEVGFNILASIHNEMSKSTATLIYI